MKHGTVAPLLWEAVCVRREDGPWSHGGQGWAEDGEREAGPFGLKWSERTLLRGRRWWAGCRGRSGGPGSAQHCHVSEARGQVQSGPADCFRGTGNAVAGTAHGSHTGPPTEATGGEVPQTAVRPTLESRPLITTFFKNKLYQRWRDDVPSLLVAM